MNRLTSAYGLVLVLLAVIVVELAVSVGGNRTEEELRAVAADVTGAPAERALALHVLANRGETTLLGATDVRGLTASQAALLREFAMTNDLSRGDGGEAQRAHLDQHPGERRGRFFLDHQVRRMLRRDLEAYFSAPD